MGELRTHAYLGTLMRLARAMASAEKSGDTEAYADAKRRHDDYSAVCLAADELHVGVDVADIMRGGDRRG